MRTDCARSCSVALLFALLSSPALHPSVTRANPAKEPAVVWYVGDCTLASDPQALSPEEQASLRVCLQAASFQDSLASFKKPLRAEHLSRLYLGLHAKQAVALHWQGFVRTQRSPQARPSSNLSDLSQGHELLTLNFGEPTLQRWRLALGRQPAAFGINQTLPGAYFAAANPSEFWQSPTYATVLTFDNLRDFTAECSLSEARLAGFLSTKAQLRQETMLSSRLSWDSSAWFATRLLASAAYEPEGSYKYGLGLINRGPQGNILQLEWVRQVPRQEGKTLAFRQLLRLLMAESPHAHKSLFFLYDDVRFSHLEAVFGQRQFFAWQKSLASTLQLSYAASYLKNKASQRYRWALLLGLGASL